MKRARWAIAPLVGWLSMVSLPEIESLSAQKKLSTTGEANRPTALRLTSHIEPNPLTSGDDFHLTATVQNTGPDPFILFLPLHVRTRGWVTFPRWRFHGTDGQTLAPWPRPFQSTMEFGVLGTLHPLAPDEELRLSFDLDLVCAVDPETGNLDSDNPIPFPAGDYTVTCSHTQNTRSVPYRPDLENWPEDQLDEVFGRRLETETSDEAEEIGEPNELLADLEEVEKLSKLIAPPLEKHVDGLWKGKSKAPLLRLRVRPSDKPSISIHGPAKLKLEQPFPIEVKIKNPQPTPIILRGHFSFRTQNRETGEWIARVDLEAPNHFVPKDTVQELTIPPHSVRDFFVDLSRVSFESRRPPIRRGTREVFSIWHDAGINLWFQDEAGNRKIISNWIYRSPQ